MRNKIGYLSLLIPFIFILCNDGGMKKEFIGRHIVHIDTVYVVLYGTSNHIDTLHTQDTALIHYIGRIDGDSFENDSLSTIRDSTSMILKLTADIFKLHYEGDNPIPPTNNIPTGNMLLIPPFKIGNFNIQAIQSGTDTETIRTIIIVP